MLLFAVKGLCALPQQGRLPGGGGLLLQQGGQLAPLVLGCQLVCKEQKARAQQDGFALFPGFDAAQVQLAEQSDDPLVGSEGGAVRRQAVAAGQGGRAGGKKGDEKLQLGQRVAPGGQAGGQLRRQDLAVFGEGAPRAARREQGGRQARLKARVRPSIRAARPRQNRAMPCRWGAARSTRGFKCRSVI